MRRGLERERGRESDKERKKEMKDVISRKFKRTKPNRHEIYP